MILIDNKVYCIEFNHIGKLFVIKNDTLYIYFVLNKDVYDFQNNLQVLSSSYNSSSNDSVGRPTNESQGKQLDVSGQQTQDSDANMDR